MCVNQKSKVCSDFGLAKGARGERQTEAIFLAENCGLLPLFFISKAIFFVRKGEF